MTSDPQHDLGPAAVVSAALGGTVDVHVSYRRTDPWMIGSAQPLGRPSR
jgi:hypothetical protein